MLKNEIAILLQGRFTEETINTIECYLKWSIAENIIVSTWEGSVDSSMKRRLTELGIHIIYSPDPKYPGYRNVNRQIVSTYAGLTWAKCQGYTHLIKVRTDHNIENLDSIIREYKGVIDGKIVAIQSQNYFKFPFMINDFIFYSKIDNLLMLFDAELSTSSNGDLGVGTRLYNLVSHFNNERNLYNDNPAVAEKYLLFNYISKHGIEVPKGFKRQSILSLYFINRYFQLIDPKDVNLKSEKKYFALEYNGPLQEYLVTLEEKRMKFLLKFVSYYSLDVLKKLSVHFKYLVKIVKTFLYK